MEETAHILVIDDDTRLRDLLQRFLSEEGFRVTSAADTAEARRKVAAFQFDLLIVDVMMPDENGLEFTQSIRKTDRIPILMLTAMGETEARIQGLEAGADDYLAKPFEPRELVLRIQSILRRAPEPQTAAPMMVALGGLVFDMGRQTLLEDDAPIRLTTTEAQLLTALAREPGRVMSRDELASLCEISGADRTIDVQVTRLRRKIEPDPKTPRYLQTVRGRGYVLRPD
ncbi:MAG: response regulator [Alphaproteobacteria bacterium]|nr:response regulator [Alphaproteobacteria bacterium]